MKFGIKSGIGITITGLILGIINMVMLYNSNSFFPKLLIVACTLFTLGLGMMIIPGVSPPEDTSNDKKVAAWWKGSPIGNRIAWILFGLIGLGAGFYIAYNLNTDLT